jgi:hypothetical protein
MPDDIVHTRRDVRVDQVNGTAKITHAFIVTDKVMLLGNVLDIAVQFARVFPEIEDPENHEDQQQQGNIHYAIVHRFRSSFCLQAANPANCIRRYV